MTLTQAAFWAALVTVAVVDLLRALQHRDHHPLAGAGANKPPGYENPATVDTTGQDSGAAP